MALEAPETLSAKEFWATHLSIAARDLVLDGTPYHHVVTAQVPVGFTSVDVKLNDNGASFDCAMVAGMVGMQVSSSDDLALSATGTDDVVRPVPGWCLYIKKS